MKPIKTANERESHAEKLNRTPSQPVEDQHPVPIENGVEEAFVLNEEGFYESVEYKRSIEIYEQFRNDIPDDTRRLFEEWEKSEWVPSDFRMEVAGNSLEAEVGYTSLYGQLHADFQREVAYYRSDAGGALSIEDARAAAYHQCTDGEEALKRLNVLMRTPVTDLRFIDVLGLHDGAPRVAAQFWELTKLKGRREFESGHLAANMSFPPDYKKSFWNIAKYLGIRESFIDEWQPRGGIEVTMIDILTQTFFQLQYWMERTVQRSGTKLRVESHAFQEWKRYQQEYFRKQAELEDGDWQLPTLSETEAIEHAALMVDRFHKMYTRHLRTMRDHRKYASIMINSANQVNIAGMDGQQINVLE